MWEKHGIKRLKIGITVYILWSKILPLKGIIRNRRGKKFSVKDNHYIDFSSKKKKKKTIFKTITKNSHTYISQNKLSYAIVTNNHKISVV